jgi:hypothetical protein
MKKIVSIFLCTLALLIVFPVTSHADVGPKPSVIIDFSGLENDSYYATLLSSEKSTGPYSALSENNADYARYQQDDEEYDIFLKFAQYKDTLKIALKHSVSAGPIIRRSALRFCYTSPIQTRFSSAASL